MKDLERIKKDVVEMDSRANVCWYDTKVLTKAVRLILEELTADRKTEPTSSKMEQVDKDINVRSKDETQTEMTTEQVVHELLSIKKILDDGKLPKQTHEIRTETHECVKDTHDKTEPQTERGE